MLPIDPFTELPAHFLANLTGAGVGVFLAFVLDRWRAGRERERQYGRVRQSCKVELGFLRSFAQSDLTSFTARGSTWYGARRLEPVQHDIPARPSPPTQNAGLTRLTREGRRIGDGWS